MKIFETIFHELVPNILVRTDQGGYGLYQDFVGKTKIQIDAALLETCLND